jgi:hypothetical protein
MFTLTLLAYSLTTTPSALLIFLAYLRICCIYLMSLYKPSPNTKTLTFLQYILTSFSIVFMFTTFLPTALTFLPLPFDPVVRYRRYTNAPVSYACIHYLSTPLSKRPANGCLLLPYGSHLPYYLIRLLVCLLET